MFTLRLNPECDYNGHSLRLLRNSDLADDRVALCQLAYARSWHSKAAGESMREIANYSCYRIVSELAQREFVAFANLLHERS
jgi:hypothetical protein